MTIAQLFLRKKPTFWPGGLSVAAPPPIELDASIREDHGSVFRWTSEPVESGAEITDHGIELPDAVSLDVSVSNVVDELLPNFQVTRHIRTYQQLRRLAQTRIPFDLVTSLQIYTSMVFDRIGTVRTKETTNRLIVTCQLRKIEIATVDVRENMADAAFEIALGERDIGAVAASAETSVAGG